MNTTDMSARQNNPDDAQARVEIQDVTPAAAEFDSAAVFILTRIEAKIDRLAAHLGVGGN